MGCAATKLFRFIVSCQLHFFVHSINKLVGVDKAVADVMAVAVGNLEGQVAVMLLEKGSQRVQLVLDWNSLLVDSHRMLLLLEVVVLQPVAVGQTTELASHR